MDRLSQLARAFYEDPDAVRGLLLPAVLLWRESPVTSTQDLLWQTVPRFEQGQSGPHDPAVFPIRKRPNQANAFALGVTLGRAANNDVALDHPSVSRFHAYLSLDPSGVCHVHDADSANGTLCNGHPIPKGKGLALTDGSRITLGDVVLHFYLPATFEAVWLNASRGLAGP